MSDFLFDLIVASGERSADMLYATHLNLPDDFIYIGCGSERIAIVSDGKLTGIFAPEASDAEYGLAMSGVTDGGKV